MYGLKTYSPTEKDLASLDLQGNQNPSRFQHGPLHSKTFPLIGLFATCDDEPLPNRIKLRQHMSGQDRKLSKGDPITFLKSKATGKLYQQIKNHNIAMLRAERDLQLPELTKEERKYNHIAKVVAEMNRAELAEQRRRVQLYCNSTELRDLNAELLGAYSTLGVIEQKKNKVSLVGQERISSKEEAAAIRERITREKKEETDKLKAKQHAYSSALIEQIRERREVRLELEKLKELERLRISQLRKTFAEEDKQTKVLEGERKKALKQELDDFYNYQICIKRALYQPDPTEVGLLFYSDQRKQNLERKRACQSAQRFAKTAFVTQQIAQIHQKHERHEAEMEDLLLREHEHREEERYMDNKNSRREARIATQDEVFLQRWNNRLRRADELEQQRYGKLPDDPTCFFKRQYRQYEEREVLNEKRNQQCYQDAWNMMTDNVARRAEAIDEQNALVAQVHRAREEFDERVAKERHIILSNTPVEALAVLREHVLTKEEKEFFNVPKRVYVPE